MHPIVPNYQATVSAELAGLLRARGRAAGTGGDTRAGESGARDARTTPSGAPPLRHHRLRRDGRRTLDVKAVEIAEARGDLAAGLPSLGPLEYRLRLFLLAGGGVVAALSMTPRADLPGRPVFLARQIADAPDLGRFLDDARPSLCFSLLPGSPAALAARNLTGIPATGFRAPDISRVRTAA